MDVIVVGGGIVGTAAAAFLAEAGTHVVLIEAEGLASGASGANSGVVQQPFDPVLAPLYHSTVALYRELSSAQVDFRLPDRPAGMLFVADEEEAAGRQAGAIEGVFPELRPEVIGGHSLRRIEPALGADLWACRVPIGYPVIPAASTYAYASRAQASGAVVRLGRPAAVEPASGGRSAAVRVGDQVIRADAVLLAAGPSTAALLDPSGRSSAIRSRWGVVVEAELSSPPRHALEAAGIDAALGVTLGQIEAAETQEDVPPEIDEVEFSLVPLPGVSAVGSTFLPRQPDPARWIEPILLRASRYVPSVLDAPIRGVRACARPQSADGRPLIGRVPGRQGLFVCAGHGPWGISTGPASARLVADLILGRDAVIVPEFDPARFEASIV